MHHLLRMMLLVLLLAIPAGAGGAAARADVQDSTATPPLVGAWMFDVDVASTDDPVLYMLFHGDGTVMVATPYYGDGVGPWRPSGSGSADATVIFQDLDPDPHHVVTGTLTAHLAIMVDETGDTFVAHIASEARWPDGTLAERDDSTGRGTRVPVEPLATGTPVSSGAASSPSQPAPPATGPGSDDTPFQAARATRYGSNPGGFWLWEPTVGAADDAAVAAGPFPVILYVDGCCVGDYPDPLSVAPWLDHLARQGYVVIAPVYRATTVLADVPALLRAALAELDRPGHAAIDPAQFAVAGYSFGGVPAISYAATADEEGLPVPKALFVMAPCVDGNLAIGATSGSTCQVPPESLTYPIGLKAVVLAFGQDFRVGLEMPRQVWNTLASLPMTDRDFVIMAGDGHGSPPILAQHETPVDALDAADRYSIWKLADALFACAFEGTWCEYALGNTPEQRFMGTWSDGVPVVELSVDGVLAAP